jgi:hypothetical protein
VHGVVDDLAFAIDGDGTALLPYLGHTEVDIGAEAGVEDDLLTAVGSSLPKSGVVQEAEVHGLFDLVDVFAGEEDVGDVGLDELDAVHAMGIGGGGEEGADEGRELRCGHDGGSIAGGGKKEEEGRRGHSIKRVFVSGD